MVIKGSLVVNVPVRLSAVVVPLFCSKIIKSAVSPGSSLALEFPLVVSAIEVPSSAIYVPCEC
jgi:hypothetical protein